MRTSLVAVKYENEHCKAISLDISDRYAPFPSLFIIHEMRVRAFWPFAASELELPDEIAWQDWIASDKLESTGEGSPFFRRKKQHREQAPWPFPPSNMMTGIITGTTGRSRSLSGKNTLALNNDVIAKILAAT